MEIASSNPVTAPSCFFFRLCFIFFFMYLLIQIFDYFIINSKSFRSLNFALMTANSPYPTELMHSAASRICFLVFATALPAKSNSDVMFCLQS